MNMKRFLLMTVAAGLFASNALAQNASSADGQQLYIAAKGKYSFAKLDAEGKGAVPFKTNVKDNFTGLSVAAGSGFQMETGTIRLELEYTRNDNAKKDRDGNQVRVKSSATFASAYFDFNTNTALRPYVGAGFGCSRIRFEGRDKTDGAFHYSAGLGYSLNDHMTLDLGYRYAVYADFTEKNKTGEAYQRNKYKMKSDEISFGVRFIF